MEDPMVRLTGLSLNPTNLLKQQQQQDSTIEPMVPPSSLPCAARAAEEDEEGLTNDPDVTIRALVSSKEAGVVIGRGGASVANVRAVTGVKVGVSKAIVGITERVLTVTGHLANVAKAYAMIAKNLCESTSNEESEQSSDEKTNSIRLLVPHQLIGSIIGKAGSKIREIQEASNAKIVVNKDMLPGSTERAVELNGVVDAIHLAVYHVGQCMVSDIDRATDSIPYDPHHSRLNGKKSSRPRRSRPNQPEGTETRTLAIPADMVGCIIGKGGQFINSIRRTSGAKLHISEQLEGREDRDVTIAGTEESTQVALDLLYTQLSKEKERRANQNTETEEEH